MPWPTCYFDVAERSLTSPTGPMLYHARNFGGSYKALRARSTHKYSRGKRRFAPKNHFFDSLVGPSNSCFGSGKFRTAYDPYLGSSKYSSYHFSGDLGPTDLSDPMGPTMLFASFS